MPATLHTILSSWDPRDVAEGERLYRKHSASRTFLRRLIPCCLSPETEITATWMLKHHIDEHGKPLPQPLADQLFAGCDTMHAWEARLHLLQCMSHIAVPAAHKKPVLRLLERCVRDDNKFVRAWALSAFVAFAAAHPRYRNRVCEMIEDAQATDPAASVRARLRTLRRDKTSWLQHHASPERK